MEAPRKVCLDTNMLIAIGQFHIDIVSELCRICDFPVKICVTDKALEELLKISTSRRREGFHAKLALSLFRDRLEVIQTESKNADDALVEVSEKGIIVATADMALRKRLKNKNNNIIVLRQKRTLGFL